MKPKQCIKILGVVILFIQGCVIDYVNDKLSLTNKSKRMLSVAYTNFNGTSELTENHIAFFIADWNIVKPDSSYIITKNGNKYAWHYYIDEGKTKKLYIYLFDTDTLKKYNGIYEIQDIVNQHKYLKLFSYSEEDLNKINWKIVYKE